MDPSNKDREVIKNCSRTKRFPPPINYLAPPARFKKYYPPTQKTVPAWCKACLPSGKRFGVQAQP